MREMKETFERVQVECKKPTIYLLIIKLAVLWLSG